MLAGVLPPGDTHKSSVAITSISFGHDIGTLRSNRTFSAAATMLIFLGLSRTTHALETGWNYTYDNENRLTSVTWINEGPRDIEGICQIEVDYQYDALGNRVQAVTTTTNGLGTETTTTERYAYDGDDLCHY